MTTPESLPAGDGARAETDNTDSHHVSFGEPDRTLPPRRWGRFRGRRPDLLCALLTAALYGTSFFLPTLVVLSDPIYGWGAFWIVTLLPWDNPPLPTGELIQTLVWWLPNPLLWIGIVFLAIGQGRRAAVLGLLALPAGLSCAFDADTFRFRFHEFQAGYYCWLASMALLTAAGAWRGLRPVFAGVFSRSRTATDE